MKKLISLLVLVLIIMACLVGCSTDKKKEPPSPAVSKVNMKDKGALYEFVNREIVELTRENFNTWEVNYFDITGDGTDEAVLVSTYGADWYEKMEIISGDSGEYKRIPSDIPLAKYKNTVDFKDGFLAVTARSGGTGAQYDDMFLFKYTGSEMVKVLDDLIVMEQVGSQETAYKKTAQINGKLTDFEYTLIKYDEYAEKETIEKKEQYTYNADTMSFDINPLEGKSESTKEQPNTKTVSEYNINKEYQFDLDGNQVVDTFKVDTDGLNYYNLLINNKKYSLDYLTPELVFNKYKLTPIADTNRYALTFYPADPPDGFELVFYEFAEGLGLKNIGAVTSGKDLFNSHIKYLTYDEVKIDNQTLTVLNVEPQAYSGNQQYAIDVKETLYLSALKNGDDVEGLTIRNIDYTKGSEKASFTLAGDTVLIGDIYYDNMWNCLMLKVTDDNYFSTSIVIEGPNDSLNFKPDYLAFRNEEALLNAISESDLNEIRNGRTFGGKIGVKDISASMKFGSESGTSCEFVQIIDGGLNY